MYSQKIIDANLDLFEAKNAWRPIRHTLDEVTEFKKYVDSVVKIGSNSKGSWIESVAPMTDKRRAEIKRWIENEQVLCGLDSFYWETNYAFVCDEKGQIYKFQPRMSQRIYESVIADFDEKQVSIELLILKGRQLGITTETALKFLHRMLFLPHTQAIMASVKAEASQLISRIIDTAYERCPFWLVPYRTPKRGFSNGSILSVQSGMQATGLAQGWTPSCLTPDSLIRVANGFVKPISSVTTDDTVITHTGKLVKVKAAFKTKREPDAARSIKLWGNHSRLKCTPEHLICTPEGWVEAAEISVGDYVVHPLRKITDEIKSFETYLYKRGKIREDKKIHFDVHLTSELGYLCGFYLAEGTCHGTNTAKKKYLSEITFSIHQNEMEDRARRLREYFGDKQNLNCKKKKKGNGASITVSCSWFVRWIAENFGRTDKKTIPDWVWSAGKEFCLGLVNGYLEGDGSTCEDRNIVVAPSICHQLILQMRDLVVSLGFGWSSIYFIPKDKYDYDQSTRKDSWILALTGLTAYRYRSMFGYFTQPLRNGEARHWRYSIGGESVEVMVESALDDYAGEFWDIEVENEDHSFTTDQCAVHNCVHLSEIADIPDPVKTIEEGLFRAAHSSKNLFMVLEGTGGGNTGWLADTWRAAKEDWPKGQSRLFPMFIPWPMCPEIYPQPDWKRKFPIENSWRPSEVTLKHVRRCESYIRNTPYLSRVAGINYRMPVEQQWFWEFNYNQACKNHTQRTWASQMPADDFESLTGKHDPIFEQDVIDEVENNIYEIVGDRRQRKNVVQEFAIIGHDVDESFYPDPSIIDTSKQVVTVKWKSHRDQRYEWEMIPLLPMDEQVERNTMDRVLIYEEPQKGQYYSCGIDTADGLGKEDEDRTVLSVANNRFQGEADKQVAEFTSNKVNAAQVVAFAACLGAYYGPYCPDSRGMKYVIEQIGRPGETCQHQLKMMGFNHHHKPKRYDNKKIKSEAGSHEGWWSSSWSVPILMTRFVEAVNGGWYVPSSKWLIEELKTLERHATSGKSKMEHRSGQHDDRVRAAAQSYFTAHDMDILTERAKRRYDVPVKKNNDPNKGRCMSNTFSVGDW